MRALPTGTTSCGFTGLYSSSAVGLDLGTGSRVDRASGAQEQTYTSQNKVSKPLPEASRRGVGGNGNGVGRKEQRGKEGGGGGRGLPREPSRSWRAEG